MAASIKIQKLSARIKERVGQLLIAETNDPRMGFVTVTRVDLARDLKTCDIFYSVLGSDADQRTTDRALQDARGFIQKKVAQILRTRTTPHITIKFDPGIEGAVRISKIIEDIAREREPDEPDEAEAVESAAGELPEEAEAEEAEAGEDTVGEDTAGESDSVRD